MWYERPFGLCTGLVTGCVIAHSYHTRLALVGQRPKRPHVGHLAVQVHRRERFRLRRHRGARGLGASDFESSQRPRSIERSDSDSSLGSSFSDYSAISKAVTIV